MANSVEKPPQNCQQLEEKDSTFTCGICVEPISEIRHFKNKANCKHPFCVECIARYIQVKIQDKTGGNILCPGLSCENRLDPLDCREMISEKLFVEWCDLICEKSIPWPNSSFCPNKKCMEVVVNECGGRVKKSKCPNCKESFCFQCNRKWVNNNHNGHICIQNGKIGNMDDVLFLRLMKKNKWAKCPGCGYCIALIEGCITTTCSRCSTEFCYGCERRICNCKSIKISLIVCLISFLIIIFVPIGFLVASNIRK